MGRRAINPHLQEAFRQSLRLVFDKFTDDYGMHPSDMIQPLVEEAKAIRESCREVDRTPEPHGENRCAARMTSQFMKGWRG